jgi:hypothetical protein
MFSVDEVSIQMNAGRDEQQQLLRSFWQFKIKKSSIYLASINTQHKVAQFQQC